MLEQAGQIPVVPVRERRQRHGPPGDEPPGDVGTEIHRGAYKVGDKPGKGFYRVDSIEGGCCVQEWSGGRFVHARACPFRRPAASR